MFVGRRPLLRCGPDASPIVSGLPTPSTSSQGVDLAALV